MPKINKRLRRTPNRSSNDSAVTFRRVQYCLDKAAQCERLAVDSTHADMKFIYREFALQWRDAARKVEQLENEQAKPLQSD
jgi:hypothetical protein